MMKLEHRTTSYTAYLAATTQTHHHGLSSCGPTPTHAWGIKELPMQAQQDSDTQNTTLVATVPTQRAQLSQQPSNARGFRHHAHFQQRHLCFTGCTDMKSSHLPGITIHQDLLSSAVPICPHTRPQIQGTPAGHCAHLRLRSSCSADCPSSRASEVRLSPSMMARLTQRIHPVAPDFQSPMLPGAQPLRRAKGPRMP